MSGSIVTRRGDDGSTALLYGQRVPKDHPQIEAVGTLDELNVALGACKVATSDDTTRRALEAIQIWLVALMGEVACAETDAQRYAESTFAKVTPEHLADLDAQIAALEARGLKFDGWATPGMNAAAVACDTARVIARRAERRLVTLAAHGRNLRPVVGACVNRLADLLWLLARAAETRA